MKTKIDWYRLSFNPLQVQTKLKMSKLKMKTKIMFQSPIGTNKTKQAGKNLIKEDRRFNPLQVQTKLKKQIGEKLIQEESQSPIGTNKTILYGTFILNKYLVSIPYRYKQNSKQQCNNSIPQKSFNPLQVQTKPRRVGVEYTRIGFSFNPLQVQTKRAANRYRRGRSRKNVSIPYRYKQNCTYKL